MANISNSIPKSNFIMEAYLYHKLILVIIISTVNMVNFNYNYYE